MRVRCVPALEGFLRGGCFDLLVALVARRHTAGRADIAVTLLARVHMPVVILFLFSDLNHQVLAAGMAEVHAVFFRPIFVE